MGRGAVSAESVSSVLRRVNKRKQTSRRPPPDGLAKSSPPSLKDRPCSPPRTETSDSPYITTYRRPGECWCIRVHLQPDRCCGVVSPPASSARRGDDRCAGCWQVGRQGHLQVYKPYKRRCQRAVRSRVSGVISQLSLHVSSVISFHSQSRCFR